MGESTGIAMIDEINKGGVPNSPLTFLASARHAGKSMYIPNQFEKWYSEGNRIPSDVKVLYADYGGYFSPYEQLSEEMRIKQMNFIYFMIKYGGGFPNAWIETKS